MPSDFVVAISCHSHRSDAGVNKSAELEPDQNTAHTSTVVGRATWVCISDAVMFTDRHCLMTHFLERMPEVKGHMPIHTT